MRLIHVGSFTYALVLACALAGLAPASSVTTQANGSDVSKGRAIFRYDTFGDEQLWTTVLRMHEVLPTVDPETALGVGLKVDVDALPRSVIARTARGHVGPHRSGNHDRAAAARCGRRRAEAAWTTRVAHERRHHVRAVSLDR